MQSVEASAKTRKEAIQQALDELGVELHEVEIEILDEGSRGLFGLGARDVRVCVTAEGLPDRPKKAKPVQKAKPARRAEPPRQRERAGPREPAKVEARPSEPVSEAGANEAAALLGEVIRHMGIEATVAVGSIEEGNIHLRVESPDSALLIGRKGRNLGALEYLIDRMFHAENGPAAAGQRVVVDIEGYQERRRQSLEEMALSLAERAKRGRREMHVKPLNPQERRIVHMALQDDPDIRTYSLGDSVLRTVVISPKGARPSDGDRPRRPRRGGSRRNGNR